MLQRIRGLPARRFSGLQPLVFLPRGSGALEVCLDPTIVSGWLFLGSSLEQRARASRTERSEQGIVRLSAFHPHPALLTLRLVPFDLTVEVAAVLDQQGAKHLLEERSPQVVFDDRLGQRRALAR